ncbi:ABC transporter permease subunit [Paenibacillus marinisediminis]
MNVFWFELKSYRSSILTWTLSLALITVAFMALFPAYASNEEVLRELLAGFPDAVLAMFALDLDTFFSIPGFYSFIFLYIALCGAIQAINMGISIISKENRHKTADFLLSKPAKRHQILTGKLFAVLAAIVFTNIVYLTTAIVSAKLMTTEAFSMKVFVLISLSLFFLQLVFAAFGVLIAVVFRKIKSVISVSLSVVFSFFIIAMLDSVLNKEAISYLTPFKFFDPNYIVANASYELPLVLYSIAVFAVAIAVSYILYIKQDVYTA